MQLEGIEVTSYSRLDMFLKCPQMFKQRYILKTEVEEEFNKHFFIGIYVHTILEEVLSNGRAPEDVYVEEFGEKIYSLGIDLDKPDIEDMLVVCMQLGELLYRCTEKCKDDTAIRNADGSIPKSPIDSPPSILKKAIRELDLYTTARPLDTKAAGFNSAFVNESITWILADVYAMVLNFKPPEWAITKYTELPISTTPNNLVLLPNGNCAINGYIDWIVEDIEGNVYIIDHKTSKDCIKPIDVMFHPQLNLYAYCYEKLYGQKVTGIGIHHVKSGNIILSKVNEKINSNLVYHINNLYEATTESKYFRHRPTDYNSPCISYDWKSGAVKSKCPYIKHCWGEYDTRVS
jgi:hypothetical protein